MYSRFVRPELVTLPISRGDHLIVKRRLTHGEQSDAQQRLIIQDPDTGKTRINVNGLAFGPVLSYLVDWTLKDPDGRAVPIKGLALEELEQVLRELDPLDFAEIKTAIEEHELRELVARDREKKTADGEPPPKGISESLSDADGDTSTYAH